jgi:hypothetical protein
MKVSGAGVGRTDLSPQISVDSDGWVRVEVVIHEHHKAVVGQQPEVPHVAHVDRWAVGHAQIAGAASLQMGAGRLKAPQ